MSDVFIGAGKATGMFFRAPKGTALPTSPMETLAEAWEEVGAITADGISLKLPSGDVLKNWANIAERKLNTENGVVSAPIMYTNAEVLKTLFGDDNVTEIAATSTHGKVTSVTFAPDVTSEPQAWLFLMKDGDTLALLGSSDALITEIGDVTFKPGEGVTWNASIDGTWTFATDDGNTTS